VLARPGEDADEDDRDGDRQGQQEGDADETSGDAGDDRRGQDRQPDDREGSQVPADDERADRLDGRRDGLRQWVEPVVRGRSGRGEAGQEGGVVGGECGAAAPGRVVDRLGLREPDGGLALREAGDEPAAEGAEDREDDEERERLVDRVLEEALLENRLLEG